MKRTAEFILGLLGGIFGFFGAIFAFFIGGVDAALNETGSSEVTGLAWGGLLFSALAIVGSIVVRKRPRLGGILMLIAAIGGLISISMAFIVSTILLMIAGLMALFRKDKTQVA